MEQQNRHWGLGCIFSLAACFALTFAVAFMLHGRTRARS